jgi:hypothetical protein
MSPLSFWPRLQLDPVSDFVAVTKLERKVLKLEKSIDALAGKILLPTALRFRV